MSNSPSRNPASNDSLSGLLGFILKKFLAKKIDSCLPATVLQYSPTANRAQVQPAIVQITTGSDQIGRAQLASVPVAQIGGGGFFQYYPVKGGDTGWIIACDRDISLFKKNYKQSAPNTFRLHNFADSWFLPDSMLNGVDLIDPTKMCLQSYDGTIGITMGDGVMTLKAPTQINFITPIVTYSGITQTQNAQGASVASSVTGGITTTGDVVAGSISLQNHVHGNVQNGSGETNPPTG